MKDLVKGTSRLTDFIDPSRGLLLVVAGNDADNQESEIYSAIADAKADHLAEEVKVAEDGDRYFAAHLCGRSVGRALGTLASWMHEFHRTWWCNATGCMSQGDELTPTVDLEFDRAGSHLVLARVLLRGDSSGAEADRQPEFVDRALAHWPAPRCGPP